MFSRRSPLLYIERIRNLMGKYKATKCDSGIVEFENR